MTRVLGIDPSLTSTGLCGVDLGEPTIRCSVVTSKPGGGGYPGMAERIDRIVTRIAAACAGVELAVMEGPGFSTQGSSLYTQGWVWGRIYETALALCGRVMVVPPALRCRYATGKGNASKDAVLTEAVRRWPTVNITGHDTADALIFAAIGCRALGRPIDAMPVTHWKPVMGKLAA